MEPIRTSGARYFSKRRQRPYADELPAPEFDRYAPEHVAFAAQAWTMRAEQERQSAGVFAALVSALVDCGEPLDLAAAFGRVVQDELAHAELCATLAARLLTDPPQAHPIARTLPAAPAERRRLALRTMLVEGAIGET